MISAIIPTKDRPVDLANAVQSIYLQTRFPNELIIVDQSESDNGIEALVPIISRQIVPKLLYVHDTTIKGLVDAKRVGVERASGDIICFLEDDIILEADYFEQIELGFSTQKEMLGCSGIITNPPNQGLLYQLFFPIFHRGIFKDKRFNIYGRFTGQENSLVPSDKLSGGVSAWRREVFEIVALDVQNGFHMFEDIDFSMRVAKYFGDVLYINPNVRLEHLSSPVNRDTIGAAQKRKVAEYVIYYKKRRGPMFVGLSFYWLLFGMFLQSIQKTIMVQSLDPLMGFFKGLYDGFSKEVVLTNESGQTLI